MNFGTACERVRETASITSTAAELTRIGQFVNEAIVDFMRDAAPVAERFTLWTVTGQRDYDLSRDVASIEVSQLRIVATGGTFTVTAGGQTTAAIAYNATEDTIIAALEALSSVDVGEVDVLLGEGTGSPLDPILVELRWLERTNMAVTASGASLTGPAAGVQVTTMSEGGQQGVLRILGDTPYDLNVDVVTDRYTVMGMSTLVLHDDPEGAEELRGWCVPRPVELIVTTDDAVTLPGPREWHRAIVYRGLQLACEWDRQDDAEIAKWEAKYEGEVGKCRRSRTRMVGGAQRRALRPSSRLSRWNNGWMDPWVGR